MYTWRYNNNNNNNIRYALFESHPTRCAYSIIILIYVLRSIVNLSVSNRHEWLIFYPPHRPCFTQPLRVYIIIHCVKCPERNVICIRSQTSVDNNYNNITIVRCVIRCGHAHRGKCVENKFRGKNYGQVWLAYNLRRRCSVP